MPIVRFKHRLLQALRRSAASAATLLASASISLLALEGGLRVWNGIPLTSFDNFVARELDIVHKQGRPAEYDPRLGWVTKSNTSWNAQGKRVSAGIYTYGDYGARMPSARVVPLQPSSAIPSGRL